MPHIPPFPALLLHACAGACLEAALLALLANAACARALTQGPGGEGTRARCTSALQAHAMQLYQIKCVCVCVCACVRAYAWEWCAYDVAINWCLLVWLCVAVCVGACVCVLQGHRLDGRMADGQGCCSAPPRREYERARMLCTASLHYAPPHAVGPAARMVAFCEAALGRQPEFLALAEQQEAGGGLMTVADGAFTWGGI